jgi:hypothetical protein
VPTPQLNQNTSTTVQASGCVGKPTQQQPSPAGRRRGAHPPMLNSSDSFFSAAIITPSFCWRSLSSPRPTKSVLRGWRRRRRLARGWRRLGLVLVGALAR